MNTASLAGEVMVPFIAATLCIAPAITRPTVPFGVRVPAERARATIIRRDAQRRPEERHHDLAGQAGRVHG